MSVKSWFEENSIWAFAFGYFACYVPYSLFTKLLSNGIVPGADGMPKVDGLAILPLSAGAAAVAMVIFLTAMNWWKYANHIQVGGLSIPTPTRWTFLSGLCASVTVGTTTLAYTFEGVSIVFAMLLMRGGVLIIAPIVDAISGRHVRWFAWMGLLMSLCALLVSLVDTKSYVITTACAIDIVAYLASYFIRLQFMSRLAKSRNDETNKRYFVEEQMVATPSLTVILALFGFFGTGELAATVRRGFTGFWNEPFVWAIILVGCLSQGTGVFGNLIYLDRRENTYCVPVNRSSSVLAGVVAAYLLMLFPNQKGPGFSQLLGAGLIIGATAFLTIPPMLQSLKQKKLAAVAGGASGRAVPFAELAENSAVNNGAKAGVEASSDPSADSKKST